VIYLSLFLSQSEFGLALGLGLAVALGLALGLAVALALGDPLDEYGGAGKEGRYTLLKSVLYTGIDVELPCDVIQEKYPFDDGVPNIPG